MAKRTDDEILADLTAKQREIEMRINTVKARSKERARKEETRRKVLVGAVILAEAERSEAAKQRLQALLDKHLVRPVDREVFGLPPRPDRPGQVVASGDQTSRPEGGDRGLISPEP